MFTGLIEDVGILTGREKSGHAAKLVVRTSLPITEIADGDSIAVNGACLTVEKTESAGLLYFHTLSETLERTNLGKEPLNARLNLERAMRMDARLGGHLVSGHVDAIATVRSLTTGATDIMLTIALPPALMPLVIAKGSIAVNGVSLTIARLEHDSFTVHVIPHTWAKTNLNTIKPSDIVNLEADLIGKYILRHRELLAETRHDKVSMDSLLDSGFLS